MVTNYFSVFDLSPSFDIDLPDLEKRYFEAQRQYHPDRLTGLSPAHRQQAIVHSMLVNEAYEALKAPLSRAQHLLALAGIGEDSVKPSQKLLMEMMELREELSKVEDAQILEKLFRQNEKQKHQILEALSEAFAQDYTKATELTMELSYLIKLGDEIRVKRKAIAT